MLSELTPRIGHPDWTRHYHRQISLKPQLKFRFLNAGSVAGQKSSIADRRDESRDSSASWRPKIAADLEANVDGVSSGRQRDKISRVIIQLMDSRPKDTGIISADSKDIMMAASAIRAELQTKMVSYNGTLRNNFTNLGLISAEMPLSRIRDLEYDDEVVYVSPDRPVASERHVENTTGAGHDDGRTQLSSFTSLNGTGIGIAVLDSGIDDTHNLVKASTGSSGCRLRQDLHQHSRQPRLLWPRHSRGLAPYG